MGVPLTPISVRNSSNKARPKMGNFNAFALTGAAFDLTNFNNYTKVTGLAIPYSELLAPTGTRAQSFCSGTSPTVARLNATGTGIKWYATLSGGNALATSTA